MIISKIVIENFLCYYEEKKFNLASGLNIILGENGEGKTKFYEALDWLFTGMIDGKDPVLSRLISAKRKKMVNIGESFSVSVSIEVKQFNEIKSIKRSFIVTKEDEEKISISPVSTKGSIARENGDREMIEGEKILDKIFPPEYRRFCLFKGEQEFIVLQNEDTLRNLVNTFTEAREYEKYTLNIAEMIKVLEKQISKEGKKSQDEILKYRKLENQISNEEREKNHLSKRLAILEKEIDSLQIDISSFESSAANATEIEKINVHISEINEEITKKQTALDLDYTKDLFDQGWILRSFKTILDIYSDKIDRFASRKLSENNEFLMNRGRQEAEENLKTLLKANLPFDVPSPDIVKKMIEDEICLVCNRPAPRDSDAFKYILGRYENYKTEAAKGRKKDESQLFPKNYIRKLENIRDFQVDNFRSSNDIDSAIQEKIDNNFNRIQEINRLKESLEDAENRKSKLVSLGNLSEEVGQRNLLNYRGWLERLAEKKREKELNYKELISLEEKLKKLKEEQKEVNTTADPNLQKMRLLYDSISTIFSETKIRKFEEFVSLLERKTNDIFARINDDSFTGNIVFEKNDSSNTITTYLQARGGEFTNPNDSLKTAMNISILFAISSIAKEYSAEDYPMIFDAPTSTFGESKTAHFLNVLNELGTQKILLIKDFIIRDSSGILKIKDDFKNIKRDKAFWIKLERPFNDKDLSTLDTQVVEL